MAKKKKQTVVIQGHRGGNAANKFDSFDLETLGLSVSALAVIAGLVILMYWINKQ